MSKFKGGALATLDAVENGAAVEVAQFEKLAVHISGTFVGTAQIQVSMDGTGWAPFGSDVTAPAVVDITIPCKQIRVICTAFTSGSIVATYGARDDDSFGN